MPWDNPNQACGLKGRENWGESNPIKVSRPFRPHRVISFSSQGIGLRPQPWAMFYRPVRPDPALSRGFDRNSKWRWSWKNPAEGAAATAYTASSGGPPRPHSRFHLGPDVPPCNLQVIAGLEIEPKLGRNAEVLLQSQRGIRRQGTPAVNQLADAGGRDVEVPGKLVLAEPKRLHELEPEDLSGEYRVKSLFFGHVCSPRLQ